MKLETINSSRLRLTINQRILHLFGLLILISSLAVILFLMKEYTITCKDKQYNRANECTLETHIFSLYHSSTPLGGLNQAFVVSTSTSKGGTVYYVNLATDHGLINLTGGSSSGRSDKDDATAGINSYISGSLATSYKVPYPNAWWIYTLVGIFPLIGFGLLLLKGSTILFDGTLQTVTITNKGLLGTNEIKLAFRDIEKVIIQESRDARGTKNYRLAIELDDKPPVPLSSIYSFSPKKIETIANQLNEFINKYKS